MLRRRLHQFIADVRPGPKMLLVVCLSFCFGLLVFYAPARNYGGVPTVWLPRPTTTATNDTIGSLPVKIDPQWRQGVRFMPFSPGEIELIEVSAKSAVLDAAKCPDLYEVSEQEPGSCTAIGSANNAPVYAVQRQKDSHNIQAYMVRGGTLIAITGVYSSDEALAYMRQLTEVPRRYVNQHLTRNLALAEKSFAALQAQRERQAELELTAYQRLPFTPVLPATMPAGWVQYAARIGTDAANPTSVDILYKKGDRSIGMYVVSREGFSLGKRCGPTPGLAKLLACNKENNRSYYEGGVNTLNRTTLYMYRPLGDAVAIVQISARNDEGQAMIFDEDTMQAQISIVESLRAVSKERLRGAGFAGSPGSPMTIIP